MVEQESDRRDCWPRECLRRRGRPRAFDREDAVQKATRLFWQHGYEGTSYDMLIQAIGISASSFQRAFGSKETLFEEVIRRSMNDASARILDTLNQPIPTRQAFETLLTGWMSEEVGDDCPSGCMLSIAALQASPAMASIRDFTTSIRREREALLAERIRRGIREGDVRPDVDADALAAYFGCLFLGMAIQSRDGIDRETLLRIARLAMDAWPGGPVA